MYIPGQAIPKEIVDLLLAAFANNEVKAELARQIRIELDNERTKYSGTTQSYHSLTAGNVNMQARMAASGYDVYGNTIIQSNKNTTNRYTHKKMKNKIRYGKQPQRGYNNRGDYNIV